MINGDCRNLDFWNNSVPKCCCDYGYGIEDAKNTSFGVSLEGVVLFWRLG